jgi:hypothetical protein
MERALSASREERPRDGTAWLEELVGAQEALERPRRVARAATLGLAGIALAAGLAYMAWSQGRGSSPAAEAGAPSVAVLAFADMSPRRTRDTWATASPRRS